MAEDEKVYNVPLREAYKKARLKRAPYAAREVKKFIKTHTKAKEVKLGKHLNEAIWSRGIKKPPHKIRVKAVLDGDVAKAELMGFEYEDFKAQPKKEKKGLQEKLLARMGQKALQKEAEEKIIEGKSEPTPETSKFIANS
ncbi:MAG: 50S ribosomal protein L31e [Candidatus Aenigmarchaeota archaeon]|nr:50S ribosomal protein L31e [Candidatus Aenigmarchaeota archaeon]